jgi:hypothetical protein
MSGWLEVFEGLWGCVFSPSISSALWQHEFFPQMCSLCATSALNEHFDLLQISQGLMHLTKGMGIGVDVAPPSFVVSLGLCGVLDMRLLFVVA